MALNSDQQLVLADKKITIGSLANMAWLGSARYWTLDSGTLLSYVVEHVVSQYLLHTLKERFDQN